MFKFIARDILLVVVVWSAGRVGVVVLLELFADLIGQRGLFFGAFCQFS